MIRIIAAATLFAVALASAQGPGQWPAKKANDWYAKQPWLVGGELHAIERHQRAGNVAG